MTGLDTFRGAVLLQRGIDGPLALGLVYVSTQCTG